MRLEGSKESSGCLGKTVPGSGNRQCKGPGAAMHLAFNKKEISVSGER